MDHKHGVRRGNLPGGLEAVLQRYAAPGDRFQGIRQLCLGFEGNWLSLDQWGGMSRELPDYPYLDGVLDELQKYDPSLGGIGVSRTVPR